MSPVVPLRFNVAVVGKEAEFAEALATREQREQHWSGPAGLGGNVKPYSGLHEVMMDRGGEMCDRLMSEYGFSEADFRYAARRLEASGDPDLETLARHIRAMEMFASEASEKEMAQMANAQESMTRQLIAGQSEEYLREQRTAIGNADSKQQHPRQAAWAPYPTNVRPAAEPDVDPDRAARGATTAAMSQRLRALAKEVAELARLSSSPAQRGRLTRRSQELQRMSTRQWQREMENEVVPASDPEEPNNVMSRLAADMDGEAAGAQPDDVVSFGDWSDEDRAGSEDRAVDDVDQQRDEFDLGEDVPQGLPPRPGRRVGEDENPGHADEPRGLRRNRADDDVLQRVRKGTARFGAGQPRGGDRFGGERRRYSAESMRESGGDMTDWLLGELDVAAKSSHSFF